MSKGYQYGSFPTLVIEMLLRTALTTSGNQCLLRETTRGGSEGRRGWGWEGRTGHVPSEIFENIRVSPDTQRYFIRLHRPEEGYAGVIDPTEAGPNLRRTSKMRFFRRRLRRSSEAHEQFPSRQLEQKTKKRGEQGHIK